MLALFRFAGRAILLFAVVASFASVIAPSVDAQRIKVGPDGFPVISRGRFGSDYVPTAVGPMGAWERCILLAVSRLASRIAYRQNTQRTTPTPSNTSLCWPRTTRITRPKTTPGFRIKRLEAARNLLVAPSSSIQSSSMSNSPSFGKAKTGLGR